MNYTDLPEEAPQTLKDHVKAQSDAGEASVGRSVWMTCEGENPADKENIGSIEYFPSMGIPDYYFPYQNQDDYLSPVVFAHLKEPKRK